MTAAIEIRDLVKRYGERAVVDRLTLDVEQGSILALLGPNGAGKTTTVETVEGYRQPDGGTVRVLGLDPIGDAPALRPRVGLMLQNGGVPTYGRPRELLHVFAAFFSEPADADGLLERVGLGEVADRPWRVLSGGERQRLSLALALVGRPEVALLDEPTAGMDPAVRAETRTLIADLRRDGVTVLLTTHDLGDVEALADRVAVIARGRLLAEGPPGSLGDTGAPADLVARFARPLTDDERRTVAAAVTGATADGPVVRIPGAAADPATTATLAAWAAGQGPAIVELGSPGASLEARYLALVGREAAAEPERAPRDVTARRRRAR